MQFSFKVYSWQNLQAEVECKLWWDYLAKEPQSDTGEWCLLFYIVSFSVHFQGKLGRPAGLRKDCLILNNVSAVQGSSLEDAPSFPHAVLHNTFFPLPLSAWPFSWGELDCKVHQCCSWLTRGISTEWHTVLPHPGCSVCGFCNPNKVTLS